MNRFLFSSLVVLAVAECYLAGGMFCELKDDPAFQCAKGKLCNIQTRPPPANITAFWACIPPCNSTTSATPTAEQEKMKQEWNKTFTECCPSANVDNLKTSEMNEKINILSLICDPKCGECLKMKWNGTMANNETTTPEWKDKLAKLTTCVNQAFGC